MRVNYGVSVTATDRWLAEIRAARAFSAGVKRDAAAGLYSHVQLFNPAASAITCIIRLTLASMGTASLIHVRTFDTALGTLVGNGVNLRSGSAGAAAELRTTDNAARLGTAVHILHALATTPIPIGPDWYFELGAARGVLVVPDDVNVNIAATFLWIEV